MMSVCNKSVFHVNPPVCSAQVLIQAEFELQRRTDFQTKYYSKFAEELKMITELKGNSCKGEMTPVQQNQNF